MAKDYRRKSAPRPKKGASTSKQLLSILVAFLVGYIASSIIKPAVVGEWINHNIIAKPEIAQKTAATANQHAQIPKPKFEFYTLLTNERAVTPAAANQPGVNTVPVAASAVTTTLTTKSASTSAQVATVAPVSTPAATVTAPVKTTPLPAPTTMVTKESYLVQIASFKNKQDAERMKASLILKGFTVTIATINQQQISWYRVIIGPYTSRNQAEKAQGAIARSDHIMGMIRKMDA